MEERLFLAQNLVILRERKDLSKAQLANLTHVPPSTLSGWEMEIPPKSVYQLKKVADFFGETIDDILFKEIRY